MTTNSNVGVNACFFVLCVGLPPAYAAHPQAETDMSNDRGSQGNQELIKGNSTSKKGDQEEKVDETKLKEDKKSAKGQQEIGEKSKVPLRTLQNN